MRFLFKTDYEDDIRLFPHSGYVWSYGALFVLLAIAPYVLSSYLVSQLVFVCIYATVGVGAADPDRLHRAGLARPRRVPCHRRLHRGLSAAVQRAVSGLFPRRRPADRRDRRDRRISGAAAAGHLSRHRHHLLCPHRRGDPGALGKRHPRQRGHAGQDHPAARHAGLARQPDLLFPLPCACWS